MGLRLRILSWWTPGWFLKKSLDDLADSTINGLEKVLNEYYASESEAKKLNESSTFHGSKTALKGNWEGKRREMAAAHNELVETLMKTIGPDKAISRGREAMFQEGLFLGRRFKKILGVGDGLEDLITAARIMYTVLGIDFVVGENGNDEMVMVVNHCSLADNYNSNTCRILSAADEGVVQGLNPNIQMRFVKRITQGHDHCLAYLKIKSVNEFHDK